MSLRERKLAELAEQVRGVEADFTSWLAETEDKKPLRKHHTQVQRLTDQLGGLAGRISADMEAVSRDGDEVLRQARRLQRRMLEVHRIWDYYRSKLGQRYVSWYEEYLAAADEFAWECYRLGAEHLDKTAPLVFMNGDFSPFTLDRGSQFTPQAVAEQQSLEYLRFVTSLPVPVIGLPWYQVAHLADLVLVAHEVGHAVWTDADLRYDAEANLIKAIGTLPAHRREAWLEWLPEVFADLYAVLAAGPAYVSALADLLAEAPERVESEFPPQASVKLHPPATLRVSLTAKALACTGFTEESAARTAAWAENYAVESPFLDDVQVVVPALLDGTYEGFHGNTLRNQVTFAPELQTGADLTAKAISKGQPTKSDDVRALVAAARLAFDLTPANAAPQKKVFTKIQSLITHRPRRERNKAVAAVDDRAAGAALYELCETMEEGP